MKKMKVRTMYMIPIFLWSVVVTHDVQPVRGRSTRRATTWGGGAATVSVVGAMGQGFLPAWTSLRWTAAAASAAFRSALRWAMNFSKSEGETAVTSATMFA